MSFAGPESIPANGLAAKEPHPTGFLPRSGAESVQSLSNLANWRRASLKQEERVAGAPHLGLWRASLVEPLRFWRFDLASPDVPQRVPEIPARSGFSGPGSWLGGLQPATSQSTRPHWPVAAATHTHAARLPQRGPQPAAAFVVTAILAKPWLESI